MPDDTTFDIDMVIHINAAFAILNQLGAGPAETFSINGPKQNWEDFSEDPKVVDLARMYVYLKVKSIFDPPQSGTVAEAVNKSIAELEWRLNSKADYNT